VNQAWLNRIATAVPPHDIHAAFVEFGRDTLADWHKRALFDRMASLADIEHRYAIFEPGPKPRDKVLDATGFYRRGAFPSTAQRMGLYEPHALNLAMQAVRALEPDGVTHLIVASCTGFSAPGLDFQIMRAAGLADSVQRTIVGFMGCFAAVNALKLADQIVRANSSSRVLVVNLELSSLHLQEDFQDVPKMLSFLLFADGAAAALITADPTALWAVHAGGRSILDSVQQGLHLGPDALRYSREILRDYGNMSSATLMFVLAKILGDSDARGAGIAMAFGPGLSVETFAFRRR
jgi:alpha-pyrone synthase